MATFRIFRETTLPATTVADSLYLVAPAAAPNYFELYATNSSNQVRRVINQADIQALVAAEVAAVTELAVVADIAARDALALTATRYVYVKNATADTSVASGGATYLYDTATTSWVKISEAESMDVVTTWASITGKPTSSVTDIDAAVTAKHSHSNKTELDAIGKNLAGELTFNNVQVKTEWSSTGW